MDLVEGSGETALSNAPLLGQATQASVPYTDDEEDEVATIVPTLTALTQDEDALPTATAQDDTSIA